MGFPLETQYAYINTPHAYLTGSSSQGEQRSEKEQYVNNLSQKQVSIANEEFKSGLYKQSLDDLKLLDTHLSGIFHEGFVCEQRADMISSLLRKDSSEWKDILNKAKYVIGNSNKSHDIAWATKIFCSVTTPEYRREFANIANGMFDCDDDSCIRVRILAALVMLTPDEINKIKIDYTERTAFAQRIRDDFQRMKSESGTSSAQRIKDELMKFYGIKA